MQILLYEVNDSIIMGSTRRRDDEQLHEAEVESLERRIMEMALERTGASSGAIFLWDAEAKGLSLDFHVAEGVYINLPQTLLRHRADGRPNGIALWVMDHNEPYLCRDASKDPNYASYFLEVASIAAVPIPYQKRAIGVLSVSSARRNAFRKVHLEELEALAASSAKFLRRSQMFRARNRESGRVLLIKGLSPEWLEVERLIEQTSPTSAPVLVQGESGTGKELVANAIHFNSARSSEPFVVVNCAAIPDQLLESTLFGHERGAFTGASTRKTGEFQKADRGTLFLDEVGELSLTLQPKVLRAVEYGEVQPLGSSAAPLKVDVRLICATNRDLPAMVRDGRFREDLFYRVSLVTMQLPPLRSYKSNLPILARVLLRQAARRHGKRVSGISGPALELLESHDYPGNVRELRNVVEHAVIMATSDEIQPGDLPRSIGPALEPEQVQASRRLGLRQQRESWLAPLEKRYLSELLTECGGNVRRAATLAGVNTVTLYRLLRKRGLRLDRRVSG